jgi:hypothetical protein
MPSTPTSQMHLLANLSGRHSCSALMPSSPTCQLSLLTSVFAGIHGQHGCLLPLLVKCTSLPICLARIHAQRRCLHPRPVYCTSFPASLQAFMASMDAFDPNPSIQNTIPDIHPQISSSRVINCTSLPITLAAIHGQHGCLHPRPVNAPPCQQSWSAWSAFMVSMDAPLPELSSPPP